MALEAEAIFKKVLILSIASYFESVIIDTLQRFADRFGDKKLTSLIRHKALSRQYHTFFQWDAKNVNQFLGLFGTDFRDAVSKQFNADLALERGASAFLSLGQRRNVFVHGNFATVAVDDTLDDIVAQYRSAECFVDHIVAQFGDPA